MPNTIPGTPFGEILQAVRNTSQRSGRLRNVSQPRFVAPINSTLSSLTPAQLAAVGVIATNADRPIRAALDAIVGEGLDDREVFNPDAPGIFGSTGINIEIRIFEPDGSFIRVLATIQGPITPQIVDFGEPRFAWEFAGFDTASGAPLTVGGTASPGDVQWVEGEDPKVFRFFDISTTPGTPIEITAPNPGTADPFVFAQPDPLAPVTQSRSPATSGEIDELDEGQRALATDLSQIIDTVTEIAEDIANNIDCDVCALLNQVLSDLFSLALDTNASFTDIDTILAESTEFDLELGACDSESLRLAAEETGIRGLADGLALIAQKLDVMHVAACNGESQLFGIPEESFTRKAGVTPQAILKVLESDPGPTGHAYTRPIRLPNFDDDLSGPFPSWTRGEWKTTAFATNGTRIVLFASSMESGATIVADLASRCQGFEDARIVSEFVPGSVSNPTLLVPFVAQLFPNGTGNNSLPSQTVRFLQDRRITTV